MLCNPEKSDNSGFNSGIFGVNSIDKYLQLFEVGKNFVSVLNKKNPYCTTLTLASKKISEDLPDFFEILNINTPRKSRILNDSHCFVIWKIPHVPELFELIILITINYYFRVWGWNLKKKKWSVYKQNGKLVFQKKNKKKLDTV